MTERRKIRWLMAHYPLHLFQRTADAFNQELEQVLPGRFEVESHTFSSYCEKYGEIKEFSYIKPIIPELEDKQKLENQQNTTVGKSVPTKNSTQKFEKLFETMANGDIEMAQTQVHIIGAVLDRTFEALDLPFLFEDHDHVSRVLDGKIGDELCENLSANSDLRGLAFTYSGGNRIIGSNKDITNLTELIDTNFIAGSYVGEKMFNDLGIKSVQYGITDIVDSGDSTAQNTAIETTYIRFTGKNVIKTNHSIFMTTILTNNRFFDSLTKEEQEAFKLVAKRVAKLEREWSIADAEAYEKNAVKNGVKIVELNKDDQDRLRKVAKNSYHYIKNLNVNPNLVKNIIVEGKK